jgi:hypothetical protein
MPSGNIVRRKILRKFGKLEFRLPDLAELLYTERTCVYWPLTQR